MKLLALTVLLYAFAFSNCEPVRRPDKQQASKPQESQPAREKPEEQAKGTETTARVVGISDGDSISVLINGNQRERVRLATIDAPENGQAFGKASRQSLSDLIYNKEIRIVTVDTDQYGRVVGEVFIGDTNVNLEQIRRGFAWHYKAHARQQDIEQREAYSATEIEARNNKTGLWKDENPMPPWEYRKQKKGN